MSFPARIFVAPTSMQSAIFLHMIALAFSWSVGTGGANAAPVPAVHANPAASQDQSQSVRQNAAPAAGEYHWVIDDGNGEPPYSLRLYIQPLPSGDIGLTGSLLLDDAELGVYGSGRIRDGKLVLDMTASGGVLQAPMDEGKRQLYPAGKAPVYVDSAGFATMRAALDPKTLDGAMQRYQTNVVSGHHVQGPMYANSVIRRRP